MASGILGTPTELNAAEETVVYTVPENTFAVLTISVVNRATGTSNVRVAVSATATPTVAEYIEFDTELTAKGVLERTGIVAQAGKNVVVESSSTEVNVMVYGIETQTV